VSLTHNKLHAFTYVSLYIALTVVLPTIVPESGAHRLAWFAAMGWTSVCALYHILQDEADRDSAMSEGERREEWLRRQW
jgi:hypothetical protein